MTILENITEADFLLFEEVLEKLQGYEREFYFAMKLGKIKPYFNGDGVLNLIVERISQNSSPAPICFSHNTILWKRSEIEKFKEEIITKRNNREL